jgi:hypothetical protein
MYADESFSGLTSEVHAYWDSTLYHPLDLPREFRSTLANPVPIGEVSGTFPSWKHLTPCFKAFTQEEDATSIHAGLVTQMPSVMTQFIKVP